MRVTAYKKMKNFFLKNENKNKKEIKMKIEKKTKNVKNQKIVKVAIFLFAINYTNTFS